MAKSLTLALKDEVHQHTRIEAAKAGKSMSQFVSDVLEQRYRQDSASSDTEKRRRLEALQRVFDGPKFKISKNGRMPTAEERNARG